MLVLSLVVVVIVIVYFLLFFFFFFCMGVYAQFPSSFPTEKKTSKSPQAGRCAGSRDVWPSPVSQTLMLFLFIFV